MWLGSRQINQGIDGITRLDHKIAFSTPSARSVGIRCSLIHHTGEVPRYGSVSLCVYSFVSLSRDSWAPSQTALLRKKANIGADSSWLVACPLVTSCQLQTAKVRSDCHQAAARLVDAFGVQRKRLRPLVSSLPSSKLSRSIAMRPVPDQIGWEGSSDKLLLHPLTPD